jgi:hypothetical protein
MSFTYMRKYPFLGKSFLLPIGCPNSGGLAARRRLPYASRKWNCRRSANTAADGAFESISQDEIAGGAALGLWEAKNARSAAVGTGIASVSPRRVTCSRLERSDYDENLLALLASDADDHRGWGGGFGQRSADC